MKPLTSLCVYCGSRKGKKSVYAKTAMALADEMVDRDIRLVYGGGGIGLMGTIAQRVADGGGEVVGIIPDFLQKIEKPFNGGTKKIVTDSMHERKQIMFDMSDAFLALPGGIGTLDEMFEMMTWRQLGQHKKPLALLNVNGYWDPFLYLLDHIVDHDFAGPDIRNNLVVESDIKCLLDRLGGARAPQKERQMSRAAAPSK